MRRGRQILGGGRPVALLLMLLALGVGVRVALAEDDPAEDASVRAYAREQLVLNARESVDPTRRAAGRLDELKATLYAKRDLLLRADAAAFGRLEKLLGEPDRDGLIRQGAVLYRWLAGQVPEPTAAAEAGEPADLRTQTIAVPHLVRERLEVPGTETLVEASAGWRTLVGYAKAEVDHEKAMEAWLRPRILALVDDRELHTPIVTQAYVHARAAQVAARVTDYQADRPARGLVSEGTVREKAERVKRILVPAGWYEQRLQELERALDRMAEAEGMLKEDAGQLGFQLEAVQRRLEAARKKEQAARVALTAYEAGGAPADDAPPKKDVPKKEPAKKGSSKPGPAQPVPAKDVPVKGEAAPKDGAKPKTDGAPAKPAAPRDAEARRLAAVVEHLAGERGRVELELERLQLREIVAQQRLRLLYITVRRAVLETQLFGAALEQVKSEAQAAERAHQAYEAELIRMRRARQLDRLDFVMARLRSERKRMEKLRATRKGEAEKILGAYDTALDHLMAVSRLTREAVTMRRALEARVKPHQGVEDAAPAGGEDERGCLPGETEAEAGVRKERASRALADDPLRRFRHPDPEAITASFVRDASKVLDHPAWGAALTAEHYDVVKARIAALDEALGLVAAADRLEARFETAHAAAITALETVAGLALGQGSAAGWWQDRLRSRRDRDLVRDTKSFTETLQGIREERRAIQDDLDLFRAYRRQLLGLGTRSFQIRVERTLDPERLAEAYDDAGGALGKAGRWVTLQGEENAGTFIGRHGWLLLACLGLLLFSILFVKLGRHALDGALRRLANRVPGLRSEPVTVRAEEAHAKREKALQEARAKAAEEEALREVSKEEADRQQKMGEGGYGGGDE